MKKILVLLFIIVLLSGCGNNSNLTSVNMEKAIPVIDEKISNMVDVLEDELKNVYNINTDLFNDYVFKVSKSSNGDIYAVIFTDEKNISEVQKKMNNYFDILIAQTEMYSPHEVNKLKNRLETSIGNYLIYIVTDNNEDIYNIIKEYAE